MKCLIVASLLLSAALALPTEAPWEAWTGPIADHQLGVHPADTPEVSVAKTQHLRAFQEVLAGLPLLPLENVTTVQKTVSEELPAPEEVSEQSGLLEEPVAALVPSTSTVLSLLAEEVPRSVIGEVPAVHAARVAHLRAVLEALEAAALFQNVE